MRACLRDTLSNGSTRSASSDLPTITRLAPISTVDPEPVSRAHGGIGPGATDGSHSNCPGETDSEARMRTVGGPSKSRPAPAAYSARAFSSWRSRAEGSTSRSAGWTDRTYWLAVAGPDSCRYRLRSASRAILPANSDGCRRPEKTRPAAPSKRRSNRRSRLRARLTTERLRWVGDSVANYRNTGLDGTISPRTGRVAELADAQDSGSCDRKIVGVQVPPRPLPTPRRGRSSSCAHHQSCNQAGGSHGPR